jgi:hypothetical protein
MADFIKYKGFKIEKCQSGYYSAWGKSVFYPIDNMYFSSKSLADVKKHINDWLNVNKIKNWCTMFPDFIAKDSLVWPR